MAMALADLRATWDIRYPHVHAVLAFVSILALIALVFALARHGVKSLGCVLPTIVQDYLRFAYTCFIKPHSGSQSRDQMAALESFYQAQASVYDRTRTRLLQGRVDMLALVAAQMAYRLRVGKLQHKPIWVDVWPLTTTRYLQS